MNKIIYGCLMAIAAWTLAACSDEMENQNDGKAISFNVGAYPTFNEGVNTRAVGTFDAGKAAWANDDEVLVKVTGFGVATQYAILTYNDGVWTPDKTLYQEANNYSIVAYYAPVYTWTAGNGTPSLKADASTGTAEYFTVSATNSTTIDFSAASRTYSRLRIVVAANQEIIVTMPDFRPANEIATLGETPVTLTSNSDGNAYLYGAWPANSDFKIADTSQKELFSRTFPTASEDGKGYVPTFMGVGDNYTHTALDGQVYACKVISSTSISAAVVYLTKQMHSGRAVKRAVAQEALDKKGARFLTKAEFEKSVLDGSITVASTENIFCYEDCAGWYSGSVFEYQATSVNPNLTAIYYLVFEVKK